MLNVIQNSIILLTSCLIVQQFITIFGQQHNEYNRTRTPLRASKQRGHHYPYDSELDTLENREEIHPLTDVTTTWNTRSRAFPKVHPCEQGSCYPATGNLLIGRERQLYASSTCGLIKPDRFCIVAHTKDPIKCFWCDSRPSKHAKQYLNHNITNTVYKFYPGTRRRTWWQSENGKENVYLQLDMEAEFHFTHLIIVFNTFRPAAMFIERSYDFKKTWHPYRYFAHNCEESFPHIPHRPPRNLSDVVCETRYSNVEPSQDGEVIYKVLQREWRIDNPYSDEIQKVLKMTNLRINFTKLHTLGDDLLDNREEIHEKYYYAIQHMIVRGSCSCYGHANRCLPINDQQQPLPDMVHGRCECTHFTKGRNCEKCEDFYNDLPWKPAVGKKTNACKRCNCNNHATSCHFDSAVYEASGRVSGGVCDGCKHNTMGTKCDQCKPFFYKDPSRDIQDPEVCRPCDCDPFGALDNGICDSITDTNNEKVAGSCHCKKNVEGRRCDSCKSGFWNFTTENPEGCQSCRCNTLGTIDNQGCNVYTGECTCKRYVIGRDCTQCLPEFYGLSEDRDGCRLCNCNPGGSFDNNCDVITGQCKCRDDMIGRTCNKTKDQHFIASLDFLTYEAELAKGSPSCKVVIREPYRDGRKDTWTGIGHMKATEGGYIVFPVDNIKTSMEYDVAVRYESSLPHTWQDATITLVRENPVDPNGRCYPYYPSNDELQIQLPPHQRSIIADHPICLEAGQAYNIRLDFKHYQIGRDTPTASVLIDSIRLIPRIDHLPWFTGAPANVAKKEEYYRRCADYIDADEEIIPEECKHHFNTISVFVFNGALSCHCNPTGSESKFCKQDGGSCKCKVNVVGRRCDRCAPGTYGFGPEGCKACDCNSIGSLNNFCNATTGQCECRANTYGRECNQCRIGFWNFPNCIRCECNGHADTCDPRTGACINCRDNTYGHNCEQCAEGFYGDPQLNVNIPCRPCPCPGIPGSGHSYASKCSLDPYTKDVVCECQEGYSGGKCDVCADNYYGNPEVPGGSCVPCDCSDKIDLLRPGNCDPHTGKCLQCLYETTGDHCEVCRPSFYRSSSDEQCRECICHILGTNSSAGPCDPNSGQCNCLPNVTGPICDKCLPNYWKIASGIGCEACNCDHIGSGDTQCNLYDGQCPCRSNFGGRQCNECRANYWGNPKEDDCHPCECNLQGSETLQCERKTGACICRKGISGHKCDQCTRGYLGDAPYCRPCGECFDNWDRILIGYKNETLYEIDRAKNIKKVGATGAYAKEFKQMQTKLDEIENILNNTDTIDLQSIEDKFDTLRQNISKIQNGTLKELDEALANATEGNSINKLKLQRFQENLSLLKNKTKELENNGTKLQEGNVQGALTLIHQARDKANVSKKIKQIEDILNFVQRQCKATENKINTGKREFEEMHDNDVESLTELKEKLEMLEDEIPVLNHLVCDGRGDPCDICGGAGCGSCGNSISCPDGAKQQAEIALSLANETEALLHSREDEANELLRNMVNTTVTRKIAQEAYDEAFKMYVAANSSLANITEFKEKMLQYKDGDDNKTSLDHMKNLVDEVFKLDVKASREEINNLSDRIRSAVDSVTNIDLIIQSTKADSEKAKALKKRAEFAKAKVTAIQNTTVEVKNSIDNSTAEQKHAEGEIQKVNMDYKKIKDTLDEAQRKTVEANITNKDTSIKVTNLKEVLGELQKEITSNDHYAKQLLNEAKSVSAKANSTQSNLKNLQKKYDTAKDKLNDTIIRVENSKEKAKRLMNRSLNLSAEVTKIETDIQKLQLLPHSKALLELEIEIKDLIEKMNTYNAIIHKRADYYKVCN